MEKTEFPAAEYQGGSLGRTERRNQAAGVGSSRVVVGQVLAPEE